MAWLFATVSDLNRQRDLLARRPYGVIEVADEQLVQVHLRPFPKLVTLAGATILGRLRHRLSRGNRCLLYYNQPLGHRNFLVLKYVESTAGASFGTFRKALNVLDQIARFKGSDALLCDASNHRISDRLLARWGWVPHCPSRWHRHFIKRFYGSYPDHTVPAASSHVAHTVRQLDTPLGTL